MPNDVYYQDDAECWLGHNAGAGDPTTWTNVSYVSATSQRNKPREERPLKGRVGNNPFDPLKPGDGFREGAGQLVFPLDVNILALVLQATLGPATTNANADLDGYYVHQWTSGGRTIREATLALVFADGVVRYLRKFSFTDLAVNIDGGMVGTQNFSMGVLGRDFERSPAGPGGTLNPHPADGQVKRAQCYVDSSIASNVLSASWRWGRPIQGNRFLSPTPTISGLSPAEGSSAGATIRVRALADAFELMANVNTEFPLVLQAGELTGNYVNFSHLKSTFEEPPLVLPESRGVIERDFITRAYQAGGTPAIVIQLQNQTASYP